MAEKKNGQVGNRTQVQSNRLEVPLRGTCSKPLSHPDHGYRSPTTEHILSLS